MHKSKDRSYDQQFLLLAGLKVRMKLAGQAAMKQQTWEDARENKKRYAWWKVLLCWVWKMFCGGGTV